MQKKRATVYQKKRDKSGDAVMSYSWRSLTEKRRSVSRVTEASLSHHHRPFISSLSSSSSFLRFIQILRPLHLDPWLVQKNKKTAKIGQNNAE